MQAAVLAFLRHQENIAHLNQFHISICKFIYKVIVYLKLKEEYFVCFLAMSFSILGAVIFNTLFSIIHVSKAQNKLTYRDLSLNEETATLTWTEILANPLTPDDTILKAIQQGEWNNYLVIFTSHYSIRVILIFKFV